MVINASSLAGCQNQWKKKNHFVILECHSGNHMKNSTVSDKLKIINVFASLSEPNNSALWIVFSQATAIHILSTTTMWQPRRINPQNMLFIVPSDMRPNQNSSLWRSSSGKILITCNLSKMNALPENYHLTGIHHVQMIKAHHNSSEMVVTLVCDTESGR